MPKAVKQNKVEDIFISVVLITDAKSKNLRKEVEELNELIKSRYSNYEIILVENHIKSAELDKVTAILAKIACVRIIRLSREYSKDICVYVGLEAAIGDIVIIRSSSDPINLIPKFIKKIGKADLVFGLSTQRTRGGIVNHYGAKIFYLYNKKFLDISIPENSTHFMALSRKAVNALTSSNRSAKHIRYLARQIGYQSTELSYRPVKNYQKEKKSIHELLISALELSTNYSKHPLRFLAWLGFAASFINLLYAVYVIVARIILRHVAQGWTTLSLQSAGMFFLLFAILAILCEYIGKILEETWHDPQYHIIDELSSKVSVADATRRNIVR